MFLSIDICIFTCIFKFMVYICALTFIRTPYLQMLCVYMHMHIYVALVSVRKYREFGSAHGSVPGSWPQPRKQGSACQEEQPMYAA